MKNILAGINFFGQSFFVVSNDRLNDDVSTIDTLIDVFAVTVVFVRWSRLQATLRNFLSLSLTVRQKYTRLFVLQAGI